MEVAAIGVMLIIIGAALMTGAFRAGYHSAKRHLRPRAELEETMAEIHRKTDTDEFRAGLDIGKEYTLNEFQHTADRVRSEIKK